MVPAAGAPGPQVEPGPRPGRPPHDGGRQRDRCCVPGRRAPPAPGPRRARCAPVPATAARTPFLGSDALGQAVPGRGRPRLAPARSAAAARTRVGPDFARRKAINSSRRRWTADRPPRTPAPPPPGHPEVHAPRPAALGRVDVHDATRTAISPRASTRSVRCNRGHQIGAEALEGRSSPGRTTTGATVDGLTRWVTARTEPTTSPGAPVARRWRATARAPIAWTLGRHVLERQGLPGGKVKRLGEESGVLGQLLASRSPGTMASTGRSAAQPGQEEARRPAAPPGGRGRSGGAATAREGRPVGAACEGKGTAASAGRVWAPQQGAALPPAAPGPVVCRGSGPGGTIWPLPESPGYSNPPRVRVGCARSPNAAGPGPKTDPAPCEVSCVAVSDLLGLLGVVDHALEVDQDHRLSPTTQPSWPGGISATSPGRTSNSVPSSMRVPNTPETRYPKWVAWQPLSLGDRLD